jgi:isopentenyl diphosphate isomerase/L-lactate dehydrogenase-like FMN-dependent dehydrogenase
MLELKVAMFVSGASNLNELRAKLDKESNDEK